MKKTRVRVYEYKNIRIQDYGSEMKQTKLKKRQAHPRNNLNIPPADSSNKKSATPKNHQNLKANQETQNIPALNPAEIKLPLPLPDLPPLPGGYVLTVSDNMVWDADLTRRLPCRAGSADFSS